MDLTINIKLGITPELADLMAKFLAKGPAPVSAAPAMPAAPEENPDPAPAPAAPAKKSRKKAEPAPEPAPEPKPGHAIDPTDDMPETVADPTEEDVRAAMHKTRQRIEGEDYKDDTESEGYKKYHSWLTKEFKALSKKLSGQEKPSALPPELRKAFIDGCEDIVTPL